MREGWEIDELQSVITQFIVPQRDRPKVFDGNVPWCRIEDIDGIYLSKSKSGLCVSQQVIDSMPLRVYPKNTVIVSCSADLGRCAIIETPLITNQTFIGLVPSKHIDSLYLYYLMGSMSTMLNSIATGATIKYLSKKKFQELQIPIPPISEQKEIVAILDKAFESIYKAKANIEKNIQNAKELFQSKLNEIFSQKGEGWEEKTIKDVTKIVAGGTPKTKIKEYWEGDIAWITPADMGKLKAREVNSTRRKITELGLKKSSAKLFPENSVILSSRAPIGHLAINTVPMSTNQGCRGIVPLETIDSIYLYYFLKSNVTLLNELGTGTTFKELSTKALGSVNIPIPPISEQKEISSELDKINNLNKTCISKYQKELENLEELKKSILQKAFNGELTAKEVAA